MPRPLPPQPFLDQLRQLDVGRSRAERRPQIDLALVQQAPAEMTVRGETRPVAGRAERLGHGGDDPDLPPEPAAVPFERVVDEGGSGAAVVQAARLEPELLLEAGADAGPRGHLPLPPPPPAPPRPTFPVPQLHRHLPPPPPS